MKRPVLLIIIIPIFILIGAGVISLLRKPTQKEENVAKENIQAIPPLPAQFTWNKLRPSESIENYNQIYITKEPEIFYEPAKVSGEVWIANLRQIKSQDFNPQRDLINYYSIKLGELNWNSEKESEGYTLNAMAGDGGLGSITGYIQIDQDKVQIINLGYNVTSFDQTTLIRDSTYWVFVSETTSIFSIIEQVENN